MSVILFGVGALIAEIGTAVGMAIFGSHKDHHHTTKNEPHQAPEDQNQGGDDNGKPSDPGSSGVHDPSEDIVYQYNGMHISDANEVGYHEIKTRRQKLFIKSYLKHIGTALAVAVPAYVGRRRVAKAIHNWRFDDDVPNTPLPDQILRATGLDYQPSRDAIRRKRPRLVAYRHGGSGRWHAIN